MTSRVVRWGEDGKPLLLANGRSRDDGRCRNEEHAYPAVFPQREVTAAGTFLSDTCVSCGTVRTILFDEGGSVIRRRFTYPRPE